MAYSDVQVTFEFGHRSVIRTKVTPEGYTHDWEVFVRGADGADINHFVEKVVFYLHETFPKPKRVIKEPPYCVKESGYAGFNLLIDIYFKNKDEPKKFKHNYDLNLQNTGPPIFKTIREKYIFTNPAGDFRKKLLKGGGIGIDAPVPGDKPFAESFPKPQKLSSLSLSKYPPPPLDAQKKHKKEPGFKPTNQFSELFGDPIKKPKASPDPKKQCPPLLLKPPTASLTVSGSKGSTAKRAGAVEKNANSDKNKACAPKEDKKRDKSSNKDGGDKKVAKPPSSPSGKIRDESKSTEESVEKRKKDKKQRDDNEVRLKYQTDKPVGERAKERDSKQLSKPGSSVSTSFCSLIEEKMRHKEAEKLHKCKHKKKDRERKEKKSEAKDKKREFKIKDDTKFKEPHSPSPPAPMKVEKRSPVATRDKPCRPLSKLFEELSENDNSDSNNSVSGDEDVIEPLPRPQSEEQRKRVLKISETDKKKKGEEKQRKQRQNLYSDDGVSDSEQRVVKELNLEMLPPIAMSNLQDGFLDMSPEYELELRELQHKIMNLDDDEELQRLVNLITETGKYEVTKKTFDFDLCTLDRATVTRLQDFFRAL